MTQEDYVSLETAKLLNIKGFKGEFHKHYWGYEPGKEFLTDDSFNPEYDYPAPTLQMAMKWLREEHHLFIGCGPRLSFTDFYWITANIYRVRKKSSLYHTEDVDDYHCVACCDSHSYEAACEAAIKYCLENLI